MLTQGSSYARPILAWHIDGILPKGPYLPCLRMADRALLAGYPRCDHDTDIMQPQTSIIPYLYYLLLSQTSLIPDLYSQISTIYRLCNWLSLQCLVSWINYLHLYVGYFLRYDLNHSWFSMMGWMIEWVIKYNSLSGNSGQQRPYSPYKPSNHSLYIGIIIFSHIDNPQSTGHNSL